MRSRRSQPSYKSGFARSAGESANPGLRKGLLWYGATSLGVTGGTLYDQSGHGLDAAITGPEWLVDSHGHSLLFDGGTTRVIDTGEVLDLGDEFSLSFWINQTAISSNLNWLMCQRTTYSSRDWQLYLNALDRTVFEIGGTNLFQSVTYIVPTVGVWEHWVFVNGGSTDHRFYRDGVLTKTDTTSASMPSPSDVFTVGKTKQSHATLYDAGSRMADVLVYDRELLDPEIKTLYQRHLAPLELRPRTISIPAADGTTVSCSLGTVTVTGLQAEVETGTTVSCSLGTVTVTGLQAEVEQGTTVSCSLGTVTVTGLAAGIEAGATVDCTLGTVTVTGLQAEIEQGTTVSCSLGTIAVTGLQAEIEQGATVDCTLGTIVVTGLQSEVEQGTTVSCSLGTVVVAGLQATVSNEPTIFCSLGTIVVSGLQAEVEQGTTIDCSLGTVVVSGLQAEIEQGTTIDCALDTVVVAGLQAEVEQGTTIDCSLGTVVVSGLQAEIEQTTTIACSVAALVVQALAASMIPPISCSLGTVTVNSLKANVAGSENTWTPDARGRTWYPGILSRTWKP